VLSGFTQTLFKTRAWTRRRLLQVRHHRLVLWLRGESRGQEALQGRRRYKYTRSTSTHIMTRSTGTSTQIRAVQVHTSWRAVLWHYVIMRYFVSKYFRIMYFTFLLICYSVNVIKHLFFFYCCSGSRWRLLLLVLHFTFDPTPRQDSTQLLNGFSK